MPSSSAAALPIFEPLEPRLLLSAALTAAPMFVLYPPSGTEQAAAVIAPAAGMSPQVTNPNPFGLSPSQIRHAYGFDTLQFGSVTGDGTGQTIAIVDAYDAPNIVSDLQIFDATFGISDNDSTGAFALTKHKMSSHLKADSGWALEISLDVEWAHAMAPGAHILLVEAKTSFTSDLLAAVDYARSQPGVVAVSMSWGGSEYPTESTDDAHFATPSNHVGGSGLAGGITFLASSGDNAAPAIWPAASPNVVGVGGTTLTVDSIGTWQLETGWADSGGGVSPYESKPTYQSGVTQSPTKRTSPDVAYDADPASGVSVYDSTTYQSESGWFKVGGTSASSPQWAAIVAIADQGRALAGNGSLDGFAQTLPELYAVTASDFRDIIDGYNGFPAGAGYDLVTGRGTPIVNLLVPDLVSGARVVSMSVNGGSAQRSQIDTLSFTFSEPVTISAGSLTLHDDTTATDVGLSGAGFNHDASSRVAMWTFTALGLLNGNYTATLIGSAVTDAAGDTLFGGDYSVEFFRVFCDANGDRRVDGGDLAVWQQNYDPIGLNSANGGPGVRFDGDWNGDGMVDGSDLAIWQQNYDALGLAAPAMAQPQVLQAASAMPMSAAPCEETADISSAAASVDPQASSPDGATVNAGGVLPAAGTPGPAVFFQFPSDEHTVIAKITPRTWIPFFMTSAGERPALSDSAFSGVRRASAAYRPAVRTQPPEQGIEDLLALAALKAPLGE